MAAARGALSSWDVVALTLIPSVVAATSGLVIYAWQAGILRRVRKQWHRRSWSTEQAREEIRSWNAAIVERASGVPDPGLMPDEDGRSATAFRVAYVALGVATLAAFVPVFTLVFSAAIIPTYGPYLRAGGGGDGGPIRLGGAAPELRAPG